MSTSTVAQEFAKSGITPEDFVKFVDGLIRDASSVLSNDLLFVTSEKVPSIDLSQLTDDRGNMESSFSFLSVPTNNLSPPTRVTNIMTNYHHKFSVSGANSGTPDKRKYHQSIEKFLALMLLIVLFVGGQPDQGPEILARDPSSEVPAELIYLKHVNRLDSDGVLQTRSIFVIHGKICVVTVDHSSRYGIRARFLPQDVSEMIVVYLACVLPFLRGLDPDDEYGQSDHIFTRPLGFWHTATYQAILRRETKVRLGKEMDLAEANRLIVNVSAFIPKKDA